MVRHWRFRFDRYWKLSDEIGPEGVPCRIWTSAVSSDGQPVFWIKGKLQRARRVAWTYWVAPIPEGGTIRFSRCGHGLCIEPRHHYLVPRKCPGERGRRKLTPDAALRLLTGA